MATVGITHRKVSSKPGPSDPGIIGGPDWNDTHRVTGLEDNANVTFGSMTLSGTLNVGSGTSQYYSSYYAPQIMEISAGTAAAPLTTVGPLVKINRTENMSAALADNSNPVDNESNASLAVYSVGVAGDGMQTNAILAAAEGKAGTHDNVGTYSVGHTSGTGTGIGTGGFFQGWASSPGGLALGTEIDVTNNTGTNWSYNPIGFSTGSIWCSASGTNLVGAAVSIGTFGAGGSQQFDVGYGATWNSILTATFRDDSNSITSIKINGSHTNGIDMTGGTFSSYVMKMPNLTLDASGLFVIKQLWVTAASGTTSATLNSATGQQATINFQDGNVAKWQILKQSGGDNSFDIFNVSTTNTPFSINPSGAVSIGEPGQAVSLTGTPTAPTPSPGDNSTKLATTAFVATSFAPLASPGLTGTPTAPTATLGDNSTKIATTAFVAANAITLASHRNYLAGLTLSTAGSSPTFTTAPGVAMDSTNAVSMSLGSSINKTTSAWAVGTGNGGLDTGAIANSTWYHVWLIERTDLSVVDVLVSLSASSPTMPANYSYKRRIGAMKTDGAGKWTLFHQVGDEFLWDVRVTDASAVAIGATTATLLTLTVPTNIQVNALFSSRLTYATNPAALIYTSPDESDQAATSDLSSLSCSSTATSNAAHFNIRTNTSAQIRLRANATGPTYGVSTFGWIDTRGKVA